MRRFLEGPDFLKGGAAAEDLEESDPMDRLLIFLFRKRQKVN
jgi:hypothetical protein